MGDFDDKSDAKYIVNRKDDFDSIRYRILATTLTVVQPGDRHTLGFRRLDEKLSHALFDRREDSPLISEHFHFHPQYGTSKEIDYLLSAHTNYGSQIGLMNVSPSFRYIVTQKTHDVAQEAHALRLFTDNEVAFLRDVGQRIFE